MLSRLIRGQGGILSKTALSNALINPLSGKSGIQGLIGRHGNCRFVSSSAVNNNVVEPTQQQKMLKGRKNEKVVLWKLYGSFHRHNTLLTLVAVVEDLDFMEKSQHLTYNEKVLYYLQLPHHPKIHISAGQLGFRKAQRAEYEAGYQVTTKMFKTIEEKNLIGPNDKLELVLKDFGKGREAFLSALQGKEGSSIKPNVVRISDDTKLQFGGSRPKKLRRL